MKYKLLLVLILSFTLFACQKDNVIESPEISEVKIISLTAIDTVLNAWQTTSITVEATGDDIEYYWEADHGEINGSGKEIQYMAGTCCAGVNTIICTVANTTNTDSENLKIRILPF